MKKNRQSSRGPATPLAADRSTVSGGAATRGEVPLQPRRHPRSQVSGNWGNIMKPAPVGEAIELKLCELLQAVGDVEPQLPQELDAAVADQLRGVEGAPEGPPAIAAQFGRQERGAGILAVGGHQHREVAANSGCRRLKVASTLVKSTRPLARDRLRLPFSEAPRPSKALADHQVDLVDGAAAVDAVGVDLHPHAAQPVERVERVEDVAAVVAGEEQRGADQVALALADERIAARRLRTDRCASCIRGAAGSRVPGRPRL